MANVTGRFVGALAARLVLLAYFSRAQEAIQPILSLPVTLMDSRVDYLNVFSDQSAVAAASAFCVRNSLSFQQHGNQLVTAIEEEWENRPSDPIVFTFIVTLDGQDIPVRFFTIV